MTTERQGSGDDRTLVTVLFTDIVGSTERAAGLGDRRWKELLLQHHALVRQELERFGGRELDTAGDGFLASFERPERAVRCGLAVSQAVRSLGINVRVGLHTGECEVIGGKVGGIGLHTGARVAGLAEADEVLVSSTVKDLVAGSGLHFTDRGVHALRGIPAKWRLFSAEDVQDVEGQKPANFRRAQRRLKSALWVTVALLIVAAVGYFVAAKYQLSMRAAPATVNTTVGNPPQSIAVPEKSIAVLPFTDMSEKHDQEYFADGMAEEIQNILAKLPQLRVLGRASSFQFKGSTDEVRTIGSRLGAAYLVSGGVNKAGSRIRVTAQLIDAKTGSHLWSERYDREFSDILLLQDEISTAIARALRVTVSARDAHLLGGAREAEAYTLYLKGKLALDSFNIHSLTEAQTDFEQALAVNPALLGAAEGEALTRKWQVIDENSDITATEAIEQARLAAEKSLTMDPRSSVGHEVLGFVAASRDFDWATAEKEMQRALALSPNDPDIHESYAEILWSRGLMNEATKQLNASLTLDPLNATTLQSLGISLYLNRDYVGAMSALRRSIVINPTIDFSHFLLGVIHLLSGRKDEALNEFAAENKVPERDAGSALAYFALGDGSRSDAALARLIHQGSRDWPYSIATVFAYRGESNNAFEWLEKAYARRDNDLQTLVRGDPLLISLHGDARWSALLKKMNLSPQ